MADISIDLEGYRVNLRVGAVVTKSEDVLVCRLSTENWWYLPGGRIKTNETSVDALNRELREEIGEFFRIRRPIVCAENFFNLHGVSFHELCTFYEVEWFGGDRILQQEGRNEVLAWIPRTEVTAVNLRPSFIKRYVINPPPTLELVIHRDGQQADAKDGYCVGAS